MVDSLSPANEQCSCRCIHHERVEAAKKHALSPKQNEHLASLFKAMGDPNRLRILWALDSEEMCVCDIALFIGTSESAVSHQLRQLRLLQLVSNRREGPVLYYRLSDSHVSSLIRLAMEHFKMEEHRNV